MKVIVLSKPQILYFYGFLYQIIACYANLNTKLHLIIFMLTITLVDVVLEILLKYNL